MVVHSATQGDCVVTKPPITSFLFTSKDLKLSALVAIDTVGGEGVACRSGGFDDEGTAVGRGEGNLEGVLDGE